MFELFSKEKKDKRIRRKRKRICWGKLILLGWVSHKTTKFNIEILLYHCFHVVLLFPVSKHDASLR